MVDLEGLVQSGVSRTPAIRINAVTSDFLPISRVTKIALELMGLPFNPPR